MAKKTNIIIDTHVHLIPRFFPHGLEEMAMEMKENNVIGINVTPTIDCLEHALDINEKFPWLMPTAGFHGLFVSEFKDGDVDEVGELIADTTVAVGALGLDLPETDFLDNPEDVAKNSKDEAEAEEAKMTAEEIENSFRIQKSVFISQIRLARNHNLPVVVHTRTSLDENAEIIEKFPDVNFVLQGWEGNKEQTKDLLKKSNKNVWFCFNGHITRKEKNISDNLREVIKAVPRNRILLESGSPSPDTIPQSLIGKAGSDVCKPWFVRETAKWIAKYLKVAMDPFIDKCNANAIEVFKLDKNILKEGTTIFETDYDPNAEQENEEANEE